jgi:hypothetical protein
MIASLCGAECGAPLFVHVLGATLLFGGALTVAVLALAARAKPEAQAAVLRKLAFRLTLFGVWPAWLAMRIGAQWALNGEHFDKDPGWVMAGGVVADGGLLVLLLLTLSGWLGLRKPRARTPHAALALLYLALLAIAWFAMSAKP